MFQCDMNMMCIRIHFDFTCIRVGWEDFLPEGLSLHNAFQRLCSLIKIKGRYRFQTHVRIICNRQRQAEMFIQDTRLVPFFDADGFYLDCNLVILE